MPFHIALFLPSLGGGGAERITLNLAQGLMQAGGTRVDLVLGKAEGPYLKDLPPGVRLINLKRSRMLFTVLPLARYLRAERPDALISALNYANVAAIMAAALSRVKIKTVVVSHVYLTGALARMHYFKRPVLLTLMRRTYPHAHAIVNLSKELAVDMRKHMRLPIERAHVIGNPVVDQNLMDKAGQPVDHPWMATRDPPTIVAVGSLIALKDFAMLLHAVAIVKRNFSARLIILGEGEERGELQRLIGELGLDGIVDMPGFVENPYSYMSRAAVVALSSRWEALPTVLIEAMACGKPIIATDCHCGPREILEDGKYGRLVPVGDAPAMAAALLDALQGKVPAPPPESWKRYGIEHAAREYLKVFEIAAVNTMRL